MVEPSLSSKATVELINSKLDILAAEAARLLIEDYRSQARAADDGKDPSRQAILEEAFKIAWHDGTRKAIGMVVTAALLQMAANAEK